MDEITMAAFSDELEKIALGRVGGANLPSPSAPNSNSNRSSNQNAPAPRAPSQRNAPGSFSSQRGGGKGGGTTNWSKPSAVSTSKPPTASWSKPASSTWGKSGKSWSKS